MFQRCLGNKTAKKFKTNLLNGGTKHLGNFTTNRLRHERQPDK